VRVTGLDIEVAVSVLVEVKNILEAQTPLEVAGVS
jgi:hypothetical protein